MATTGLAHVRETENELSLAAETYRRVLPLAGEPPLPVTCGAHLGLARVHYEWNDLDAAEEHGQQSVQLAQQLEQTDRTIACELMLARLKLTRGDVAGAAAILAEADRSARQHGFVMQMPDIVAAQVQILLRQDNLEAAAQLAEAHELPLSRARVYLAQGDASAALAVLEPLLRQAEAKGWADEKLKVMVLLAVAHHAHGDGGEALELLDGVLTLAEPDGFIRLFVDQGPLMAQLLSAAQDLGIMPDYVGTLLSAFSAETDENEVAQASPPASSASPLIEPLSERELEVLQLIAQGLSNREICERLYLALSTVKGHNRNIYGKLQVQRRTEAVARARELGLV